MKLEVCNVTKSYRNKKAVDNFSMKLQSKECVGLIGPNGAGKSTLLQIISTIIKQTEGTVLLDGVEISKMKKQIGYLPQFPYFFEWMTAREALLYAGQLSGIEKQELAKSIPDMLKKVQLLREQHTKISSFSGGMKQRLGMAQALLHRPSLIVMDEPVSALDPTGRRDVLNLIQDLRKEATVLFSTHILSDAEEACERFLIIKDGKKINDTTVSEMMSRQINDELIIQTTTQHQGWLTGLQHLEYVETVKALGSASLVTVNNMKASKLQLLQHALNNRVDLIRFEEKHASLEEIYLDLVGKA